ncbi:MAG: response regulator [Anaerolineales bacterium]
MNIEAKTPFVMIIEDDRDIASYYRHVMDMAGYRTEIVANGKVAVENLYKSSPDIVLLDLNLPGVSGVEVLKILKADDRLKQIRVVVVTGYSEIAADLPEEPDLVLMKPVSPNQLTDLVWRLFQTDKTMEKRPFGNNPWDKSTGLYNRSFFIHRLGFALRNCREIKENMFGVLMVSLDSRNRVRTKPDRTPKEPRLQEFAKLLKASLRLTDTLARFDKDNFYILVENIQGREILSMIVNRFRSSLVKHSMEEIRFNIGAILCDGSYNNIDEILRDVKAAQSDSGRSNTL